MRLKRRYWANDRDAPFAELMRTVETYLHPEAQGDTESWIDELNDDLRRGRDWTLRFKEQHREALEHPERLPTGAEHLGEAAGFSDGTDERFLRRLWRDLYPDEPVPGGDDEFRDDLRRTITGDLDRRTSTTRYYLDPRKPIVEDAKQVWARFYPDKPVPG